LLQAILAVGQLLERGRECLRIFLCCAESIEECQVDFVVRNLLGLARQIFFLLCIRQGPIPPRRL